MEEKRTDEPRSLVIIDPDQGFAREIEEELLRRFGGDTAVQLITEVPFLENYFRVARDIDVLVIDRDFYGEFLEEHTIRQIFVMTPEVEVDRVYPGNVRTLMNYLPSGEILDEIEQALQPEPDADGPDGGLAERETKVIAVTSPVGGCGKSLAAYALARKLRKLDQTVLLVGCDSMQSISVFLPQREYAEKGLADALQNVTDKTHWNILQNVERDEVDYLRPFEQDLYSAGVGMREWAALIRVMREKQDFDYLVLDLGPTVSPDIQAVFEQIDVLVLITEENEAASGKLARLQNSPDRLPRCECILIANEYRSDGLRLAPETIFGTIAPYPHWMEALEDPVFYRIALKVTE